VYIKCFKIVGSGRRETYDAPQSSLHQIILPGRGGKERKEEGRSGNGDGLLRPYTRVFCCYIVSSAFMDATSKPPPQPSISRKSFSRGKTYGTPLMAAATRQKRQTNKQTDRQTYEHRRCKSPLRRGLETFFQLHLL